MEDNNLIVKEPREQFDYMVNELGIEPINEFNEDWSLDLEIQGRLDFRDKITEVEDTMIENGALVGDDFDKLNPLTHEFTDGQYVRRIYMPAGQICTTKIHMKNHPFFVMTGYISVLTEKGIQHIRAPYHGITKPGTKRIIYVHENCVFITVHATDKTTIEEVTKDVVCSKYEDLPPSIDVIETLKKINLKIE